MQATARYLRRQMTRAESVLWQRLRDRQLGGLKFRRQHPIGGYILDFYCAAASLAIEVDGPVHARQSEADANRDALLAERGIQVLRVSNVDVLERLEETAERIAKTALDRQKM
jgi:very-short-patch-repair endonuclease